MVKESPYLHFRFECCQPHSSRMVSISCAKILQRSPHFQYTIKCKLTLSRYITDICRLYSCCEQIFEASQSPFTWYTAYYIYVYGSYSLQWLRNLNFKNVAIHYCHISVLANSRICSAVPILHRFRPRSCIARYY